ncbi:MULTISPECIES: hypothetical protein [unclassified Clostridium]|uniref:hypothetical protein n=1 Tax=unclassified Clostridium TaxID=2614128 RepID=UPI0013F0DB82|nr:MULTISPECIES: hypothetical protein [unclassified Clostridium]NFG60604.1 hypothetical protein [Clostridium botulinum]NFQ09753.1 hypothetical protein [Clostridium botulinum]
MVPLILIAIGIILIVYNYKIMSKGTTSFEFTLNEEKENLNDYKLELGLLRKDIGESLTELQQEIKTIKVNLNMINDIEEEYDNILDSNIYKTKSTSELENNIQEEHIAIEQSETEEISNGIISEINFQTQKVTNESNKQLMITDLIKQNLTDEEICKVLSISKGEVLLVRNLFKS